MQLATRIKEYPRIVHAEAHVRFEEADYLAIMCHEIATPLNAIIGLSYILANVECSPQKKNECGEMLRDSSNMIMELLKNMLEHSRIDAGMTEVENIAFDLTKVVQEAVHIIAVKASEKGLDLNVHIANELPTQCIGDPLRIRQILLNLLNNAIKFTEKGQVSLDVNKTTNMHGNDQLCITVADTGIGIKEEFIEKIFDKYTQADSSVSRKYGGTGLGLSISQELARLMQGSIAVKSWLGIGSHFIVTLPLQSASIRIVLSLHK